MPQILSFWFVLIHSPLLSYRYGGIIYFMVSLYKPLWRILNTIETALIRTGCDRKCGFIITRFMIWSQCNDLGVEWLALHLEERTGRERKLVAASSSIEPHQLDRPLCAHTLAAVSDSSFDKNLIISGNDILLILTTIVYVIGTNVWYTNV